MAKLPLKIKYQRLAKDVWLNLNEEEKEVLKDYCKRTMNTNPILYINNHIVDEFDELLSKNKIEEGEVVQKIFDIMLQKIKEKIII